MHKKRLVLTFALTTAIALGTAFAQTPRSLPASFDPRPLGLTTPVGHQGSSLACWAFAAIGNIEHLILKETGKTYQFSQQHLRFNTSRSNTSQSVFNTHPGAGEGYARATAMMDGVVLLSDIPYVAALPRDREHPLPANFHTAPRRYRTTGRITITREQENSVRIKTAILEYGGVVGHHRGKRSSTPNLVNPATFARYWNTAAMGTATGSHAVLFVGWDDDFPKENFLVTPPANGAWLYKDSYGTGRDDGGYTWVSYYDETLRSFSAFTGFSAVTEDEKIVAHYELALDNGNYLSTTNARRRFPVAGVYEISEEDAAQYQVNKITFYGYADHRHNIHIIQAPIDGKLPLINDPLWGEPLASDITIPSIADRGWITVQLDRPFIPAAGKYIVMIDTYRISETNDTRFAIAFGSPLSERDENGKRAISPQNSPGQCFTYNWSKNGSWRDVYERLTVEKYGVPRHGGLLMQVVLQKKHQSCTQRTDAASAFIKGPTINASE